MMTLTNGESMSLAEVKFCFNTLFNFMNSKLIFYRVVWRTNQLILKKAY